MKKIRKILIAVISLLIIVSMFACSARPPYDFDILNYLDLADFQNIVLNRSEIDEQLREIIDELLEANASNVNVRNRPIQLDDIVGFNFRAFTEFVLQDNDHGLSEDDFAILNFFGILNFEEASGQVTADQHLIVSFRVYIDGVEYFRGDRAENVLLSILAADADADDDADVLLVIIADALRGVTVERGQTLELDIEMPGTFPLFEDGEEEDAVVRVTIHEHFDGDVFPITVGTNRIVEYDGSFSIGTGPSLADIIEGLEGKSVDDGLFTIETTFPSTQPPIRESADATSAVVQALAGEDVTFFLDITQIFTAEAVAYRGSAVPEVMARYVLGSEVFVDGFEDYLLGVYFLEGDWLVFTISFPENYGRNEDGSNVAGTIGTNGRALAGEDVTFIVTLTLHQEVVLPEFDDEFVREETDFDSVEEFEYETTRNIKANLAFQFLMEYSVATSFPQRLLRNRYDEIFQGYITFIFQQGFMFGVNNLHDFARMQDPTWTLEDLEDHTAIVAGIEIKRNMIFHQIARELNMSIPDDEFETRLAEQILEQFEAQRQQMHETTLELFMTFREFDRTVRRQLDRNEMEQAFLFDDVRDWVIDNLEINEDVEDDDNGDE